MTRSSTRALIENQPDIENQPRIEAAPTTSTGRPSAEQAPVDAAPVPEESTTVPRTARAEPGPVPTPASGPAPPDALRLWVGYAGDYFARTGWQHGIALGAGFLGFAPLYAALTFTLTPAVDVTSEAVAFSLRRLPFAARFGYRLVADSIALDAELGLLLEWLHRSPSEAREVMGAQVTATSRSSDGLLSALTPRVRAELRMSPSVGLYAGGGLDILFNDFAYVSKGTGAKELLHPNRFRPVAELGISFYP